MHRETFVQVIQWRVTYKQHSALFHCSFSAVRLDRFLLHRCLEKCAADPEIVGQRRRQRDLFLIRRGFLAYGTGNILDTPAKHGRETT
jgi:hypothetical protein